jgi:hypothetical protein
VSRSKSLSLAVLVARWVFNRPGLRTAFYFTNAFVPQSPVHSAEVLWPSGVCSSCLNFISSSSQMGATVKCDARDLQVGLGCFRPMNLCPGQISKYVPGLRLRSAIFSTSNLGCQCSADAAASGAHCHGWTGFVFGQNTLNHVRDHDCKSDIRVCRGFCINKYQVYYQVFNDGISGFNNNGFFYEPASLRLLPES